MKKILQITLLSLLPFLLSAQIPTTGLLAYYPFSGNANDYSLNGFNGTVNGAALATDRFGNANCAYSFNGTSDYISVPTTSITGLDNYSYSTWIQPQGYTSPSGGMAWCSGENGPYCQGLTFQFAGTIFAGSYNIGSNPTQSYSQSSAYPLSSWIHVVVTRDNTAIKLYVNGVLTGYATNSNNNGQSANYGSTSPSRVLLGARSNLTAYFNGLIDDVRIYSTTLSQSDVNALYNESCFQSYPATSYNTCENVPVTFTAVPITGSTSWYSSPTNTVALATGTAYSPPTYTAAGTYTYYVSANSCTVSAFTPITVNVFPAPVVSANSGVLCSGGTFTINPTGVVTSTISGGSNIVSPTVTTSYSVVGTSSAGCMSSNTAISTVTVGTTPTVNVNSGFVCSGSSYTLTPSGATSYSYSNGSAIVTPTANTSYTVTGISGSCSSTVVSNVAVVATPTVIISGSNNICINGSTTLTAGGANIYTWSNGMTGSTIVVTPTATTTYSVVGANFLACINTGSTTVVVNPLPVISVNSGSVCIGSTFNINPSGASSYTVSGGSMLVSPLVNTSYTVTGTSAAGCAASNTAISNVSVVATPTISVNSGSICAGQSFTITASGGSSYVYSSGSSVVTPANTSNYTVTGSNASGCTSSAISSVTVNALPSLIISSPGSICSGNSTFLTSSGASTYLWNTGSTASTLSVSPANTTSYSVIGTDANGCINTATTLLTVNPLPVVSVNSGSICLGNIFTINPSGAFSYSISGGSFNVSPSINTNYSITGTSAAGCQSSNTAVSTVIVMSTPTISVNSGTICYGGSFTMSPTGASTYSYSNGSPIVNPTADASYTVTGINSNGCSASAISSVTVFALPGVTISSPASICVGDVVTLTANGASNYLWSTGSSSASIFISPANTSSYSVTGTDNSGCTNSASTTLIVNPLPVLSVNSGSVCLGGIFTINPSGAATYTISGGSLAVSPSADTDYTLTGTSAQGCDASLSVISSVSVITVPVISVNSGSVCSGNSFTMTPSGGVTYTYSNGTDVVNPTSDATFTVTGSNTLGCTSSAVSTVSVIQLPLVTTNSGSICAGDVFIINPSGAATYTISSGSSSVTPSANTSYTIIGSDASGCISLPAVSNVTVNAIPVLSVNSGTICSGATFTMFPTGASTYTYSNGSNMATPLTDDNYTITGTSAEGCVSAIPVVASVSVIALPVITVNSGTICAGDNFTLTPSGASNYTFSSGTAIVNPLNSATYTVIGAGSNGCVSNAVISPVYVNALPVISIGGPTSICAGTTLTLTASGAITYTWSNTTYNATVLVIPSTNTQYSVSGTDLNGCNNSATFSVTVNSLPIVNVASGAVCSGNSFTFTPTGAVSYTYQNGSNVVTPGVTSTYTILGEDANGCESAPAMATVSVVSSLSVSISGPTSVCQNGTITLTANGAATYIWNSVTQSSTLNVSPSTNTIYTVIGSSGSCSSSATTTISVNSLPVVGIQSSESATACVDEMITLNATGATTYLWDDGATTPSISITATATSVYTVTGTNTTGCSAHASYALFVTICEGISINQTQNWNLSIYPNPNNGSFTIKCNATIPVNSVFMIEDINGKTVKSYELNPNTELFEVNDLAVARGIYFCRLIINKRTVLTDKLIITN